MKEVLNLPCLYKVFLNSRRNAYWFRTSSRAEYEVLFTFDNSLFVGTELEGFGIYSVAINKVKKGVGGADPEIQLTILSILNHFFQDRNRILTFVYDSMDGKEVIRMRLFKIWESKYRFSSKIQKLDGLIKWSGLEYQSGILFQSKNSIGPDAVERAYSEIMELLKDK